MRRSVPGALLLSAAVALGVLLPAANPSPVLGACVKQLTWSDHIPQQAAEGARMKWLGRVTHATDWAAGGFASQVLWVGTNNKQADDEWVEVGLTHGFQGINDWTFYTARLSATGGYDEARFTSRDPGVGVAYYWYVKKSTSTAYSAYINNIAQAWTISILWSGHATPTVDFSGGLEATCNDSRVDRTYVSVSQFLRSSDAAWVNVNNGTLHDQAGDPDGGTAWCAQPTRFRYYLNSQIDKTLCQ